MSGATHPPPGRVRSGFGLGLILLGSCLGAAGAYTTLFLWSWGAEVLCVGGLCSTLALSLILVGAGVGIVVGGLILLRGHGSGGRA